MAPKASSTVSILGFELPIKYLSLVVLVIQNSALYLMLRASRQGENAEKLYLPGAAVLLAESCKMFASLFFIYAEEGSVQGWLNRLNEDIIKKPGITLKIVVPAGLYTLQNTLQYMAVTYLDAATFQVTYQLKVLTTALFAVILLGKRLSGLQWVSLVLLTAGVALIQMPHSDSSAPSEEVGSIEGDSNSAEEDVSGIAGQFVGLIMILTACFCSGFAGVYFEKVLKGETAGLWVMNVQLAGFSVLIAAFSLLYSHSTEIAENGFFYGFNTQAFIAIALQAFGGLIVAVVVKYADNILKGFATSISIVISSIVSFFFLDFVITGAFGIGTTLVIGATYMYGTYGISQPKPILPTASK